jgi:hypothetical protein
MNYIEQLSDEALENMLNASSGCVVITTIANTYGFC